jgi:carbamoylphosphate synthase large subunit
LLETAFKAFDNLRFTGLGNIECLWDARDRQFKFLEINPRVWGNVGFAEHAGVDLVTPYRQLADGASVRPDLRFKIGVRYPRWLNDLRLVVKRPGRFFGFVGDCLKPDIHSDFCWSDLPATLPVGYFLKRLQQSI